jgi:hypothetical protein
MVSRRVSRVEVAHGGRARVERRITGLAKLLDVFGSCCSDLIQDYLIF